MTRQAGAERTPETPVSSPARTWIALAALLIVFDVVRIAAIRHGTGDEFIYFYMAKLVAGGRVPYRDFFFSHPPLALVPPAIVFSAAGFQFTALKLLAILVTNGTAVMLFAYARRAAGAFAGVLAAALFLFSATVLTFGSVYVGQEMTVAFIAAGLVALQRRRPLVAGICIGLAMLCGVYAACAAVVVFLALARTDWVALSRWLVGFAATFAVGTGVCLAVAGSAYWEQTVVFQTLKREDAVNAKWAIVAQIAAIDPAIVALACVAAWRRTLRLPFAIGCAYVAAILVFANVHLVYAELCIPFFALTASAGLAGLAERVRVAKLAPAAVASAVAGVLGTIGLVRSGTIFAGPDPYELEVIAREVRTLSEPGETVFGEASVTPLIALLAGRDIVGDHVDTTGVNYVTGAVGLRPVMERLGPRWPGVLVVRNTYIPTGPREGTNIARGPMMDAGFANFVYANFTQVREFANATDPREAILLYVRNERAPGAPGAAPR